MNKEQIAKEITEEIAKIVQKEVDEIGLNEPIHLMGIDSVAGVGLINEIHERYHIEISAAEFFEGLTIQDIVEKSKKEISHLSLEENLVPFTVTQKAIWSFQKQHEEPIYNDVFTIHIKGHLTKTTVKKIFKNIIKTHPLLRSKIILKEDVPYFCILNEVDLKIESEIDISKVINQKFNFEKGPLFRLCLNSIDKLTHNLHIVLHHLIHDQNSFKIILDNFIHHLEGQNINTEKKTFQDFVIEQELYIQAHQNDCVNFWKKKIQNIPLLNIQDFERTTPEQLELETIQIKLTKEESNKIEKYCITHKIKPDIFFLSLFCIQIFAKCRKSKFAIGYPFSSRNEEFFQTVGLLEDIFPLTLTLDRNFTLQEIFKILENSISEIKKYESYPFYQIVHDLNLSNTDILPVFQCQFSYEAGFELTKIKNYSILIPSFKNDYNRFDLKLKIHSSQDNKVIFFQFNKSLFKHDTMQQYVTELQLFLEGILQGQYKKVSDYPSQITSVESSIKSNLDFSLFYFSSVGSGKDHNKYHLVTETAKKADELSLASIWIPERHFHPFGGLFPNPSPVLAYLAEITKSIRLRAGSYVLPLHHPLRVAEELAVIDNLSHGRVDVAVACGWNPNDFILNPSIYETRREKLFEFINIINQSWNGNKVPFKNGKGELFEASIFPTPLQENLNIWLTCTESEIGFKDAGKQGLNVLTALLFQKLEDLDHKIQIYKNTLKEHFPNKKGHVTLMLHTFIGHDLVKVKKIVKKPLINYLKSSYSLWAPHAKKLSDLSLTEQEQILDFAFERYFNQSSLIGDMRKCENFCKNLIKMGVDEIACLIDFGVPDKEVLMSVEFIGQLQELFRNPYSKSNYNRYQPVFLEAFEKHVTHLNDKVIVSDKHTQLTYNEFEERAENLAKELYSQGIRAKDVVGVYLHRSYKLPITLLAIFKLGATYLPLDPYAPWERLQFILHESQAKKIIVDDEKVTVFKEKTFYYRDHSSIFKRPKTHYHEQDIAYITYTSSYEGGPKGIPISFKSLDNFLLGIRKKLELTNEHMFLALSSFSLDISLFELLMPLKIGGSLHVVDEEEKSNGFLLNDIVSKVKPTLIHANTLTFNMLLRSGWLPNSTQSLLIWGDFLIPEAGKKLLKYSKELWLMYGAAEASIWTSAAKIKDPFDIFIGEPIDNIQYHILDDDLNEVYDRIGELCISGVGLAKGYINNFELNESRWKYLPDQNLLVYKTGDLVRKSGDNKIAYIGRKDKRIKFRGYLIDPKEITDVLLKLPQIKEVEILMKHDKNGFEFLVLYYTLNFSDPSITHESITEYLSAKLPTYMIPSYFIHLNLFPKSNHNDIEIHKLPFSFNLETQTLITNSYDLKELWEKLLKDSIDVDSHFFKMGGDSVLLTELLFYIKQSLPHLNFPIEKFIHNPTFGFMVHLLGFEKVNMNKKSSGLIEKDSEITFQIPTNADKKVNILDPKNIFITGANGFISIHLIVELLKTNAKLFCLIRAKSIDEAKERMISRFKEYHLYDETLLKKIEIVIGDLDQENLGIPILKYEWLSEKIDIIFHSGANINFLENYEQLRQTNVLGTKRVIDFGMNKRLKPITFLSSYSVYDAVKESHFEEDDHQNKIFDYTLVPDPNDLRNGYEQTKLVAEKLIHHAMNAGLPAIILRPGRIFYNKESQVINRRDLVYYILKTIREVKSYPEDFVGIINNYDVRYVSSFMVKVALNPNSYGKSFNLVASDPLTWEAIFEYFSKKDSSIIKKHSENWLADLQKELKNQDKETAAIFYALYALYLQEKKRIHRMTESRFLHLPSIEYIDKEISKEIASKNELLEFLFKVIQDF